MALDRTQHTRPTPAAERLTPGAITELSSRRESGLTVLLLAFFAIAWFGWGAAEASDTLSTLLGVGSGVALVIALLGVLRLVRRARGGRAAGGRSTRRRYGLVVAVEGAAAGLGAAALSATGAGAYVPVWVCAVVGLHFVALAPVFGAPPLRWLGMAITAVAPAGLLVGLFTAVAPTNVTGAGTGLVLLGFAALMLARPAAPARDLA